MRLNPTLEAMLQLARGLLLVILVPTHLLIAAFIGWFGDEREPIIGETVEPHFNALRLLIVLIYASVIVPLLSYAAWGAREKLRWITFGLALALPLVLFGPLLMDS